jgi:chromosome segregation ATPase
VRAFQQAVGSGDKLTSKQEEARAEYEDARAELMRTRRELRRLRVQAAALERAGQKGRTESEHKAKQPKLREEIDFLQELEKQLVLDMERLARDLPAEQRELERQEEVLKVIAKEVSLLSIEIEAGSRVIEVQPAVLRKTRLQ